MFGAGGRISAGSGGERNAAGGPGDTGWVSPGTVVNHEPADQPWLTIDNVKNTTSSVSTAVLYEDYVDYEGEASYIRATNFDFSAVPADATLVRFYVRFKWKKAETHSMSTSGFFIAKAGAVNGNASSAMSPSTSFTTFERSSDASANALWGTTGITVDDVRNDSTFGCFAGGIRTNEIYDEIIMTAEFIEMKVEWE